jgi:hypothetical protein
VSATVEAESASRSWPVPCSGRLVRILIPLVAAFCAWTLRWFVMSPRRDENDRDGQTVGYAAFDRIQRLARARRGVPVAPTKNDAAKRSSSR